MSRYRSNPLMTQSFPAKYGYVLPSDFIRVTGSTNSPFQVKVGLSDGESWTSVNDFGRAPEINTWMPHAAPSFEKEYMLSFGEAEKQYGGLWKTELDKCKPRGYAPDRIIADDLADMDMIRVTKDKGFDKSHIGKTVIGGGGDRGTLIGVDPNPTSLPFLVQRHGDGGWECTAYSRVPIQSGATLGMKHLQWYSSYDIAANEVAKPDTPIRQWLEGSQVDNARFWSLADSVVGKEYVVAAVRKGDSPKLLGLLGKRVRVTANVSDNYSAEDTIKGPRRVTLLLLDSAPENYHTFITGYPENDAIMLGEPFRPPITLSAAYESKLFREGTWWEVVTPSGYADGYKTNAGALLHVRPPHPHDRGDDSFVRVDVFSQNGEQAEGLDDGWLLCPRSLDAGMVIRQVSRPGMIRFAPKSAEAGVSLPKAMVTAADPKDAYLSAKASQLLAYATDKVFVDALAYHGVSNPQEKKRTIPLIKPIKPKTTFMSRLWNAIKNKALSADEKLLRKHNLKTECGDYTPEYQEIVLRKLCEDKEADVVADLKASIEEEKAEKCADKK